MTARTLSRLIDRWIAGDEDGVIEVIAREKPYRHDIARLSAQILLECGNNSSVRFCDKLETAEHMEFSEDEELDPAELPRW